MKFSIVTLSFNQVEYLRETIESVIAQRGPKTEVEYIIVDPGSSDGSRELICEYGDEIEHCLFEPDTGPPNGLNKGFSMATGDLFGYLNSDDVFEPNALVSVADYIAARPDVDVVLGDGIRVDSRGRYLRPIIANTFSLRKYAHGASVIMQPSTFMKADAFRLSGGFNEHNRTCWDGELLVDLALQGSRFANLHLPLSRFREHQSSITSGILSDNSAFASRYTMDQARISQRILDGPPRRLSTLAWRTYGRSERLGRFAWAKLRHRL